MKCIKCYDTGRYADQKLWSDGWGMTTVRCDCQTAIDLAETQHILAMAARAVGDEYGWRSPERERVTRISSAYSQAQAAGLA